MTITKWHAVSVGALVLATGAYGCGGSSGKGDAGPDSRTISGGAGGSFTGAGGSNGTGGAGGGGTGGSCNGAAPCGGALEGTWQIDSLCVQGDLAAAATAQMGLPAACGTVVQSATVKDPSGTLTYSGGTEVADIGIVIDMRVSISEVCAAALAGMPVTLSDAVCAMIPQVLAANGEYSAATCTYASASCLCDLEANRRMTTTSAYSVSGTNIVYSDGTSPPAGYCVSGNTLTEQGTWADLTGVTGISTFHRAH